MSSLAHREREDLCDLVLSLGPTAPTLLDGWDATDLVTHLLVRERHPLGAAGILVPPLSGLTPYALPGVGTLLNTLELLVHHEDLRRARPGWAPRTLAPADLDLVWRLATGMGRLLVRPSGVPVRVVRSDTGAAVTLRRGPDPVVVTGPVVEVTLFLFGRSAVRELSLDGPPHAVAALESADLGL